MLVGFEILINHTIKINANIKDLQKFRLRTRRRRNGDDGHLVRVNGCGGWLCVHVRMLVAF